MNERRNFKRLDVSLPVTLRYGGRLIPATALNVSCGGIYLNVENDEVPFEKGPQKVEVIIDLSKEERDVSLKAEIMRVEKGKLPKLGLRFVNLYTVGHQTLESFINRNKN